VAFKRVELAAAESRDIELTVPARAFEVWDAQAHRWHAPSGRYEIFIGRSSREILFRHSFDRP
jgi:beta-glucosidase